MFSQISLWLGRLSVGRKLTLIYLLDLTAVIYISGILIHEKYLAIDFARKEISGAVYAEAVRQNLTDVFLGKAPSALAAFDDARERFDASLKTADQSRQMRELLAAPHGGDQETRLLAQGRELLTSVGNQSNLILDPDLDSYYVMSLTLLRFPELLQVLYDSQQFMRLHAQTRRDPDSVARLQAMAGRLDAVLQSVRSDYTQTWLAASPALKAALDEGRLRLLQDARSYASAVKSAAYETPTEASQRALEAAHQRAMQTLSATWQTGIEQLQILLHARVESLFQRMWLHLGTALLLLGGILSMVYLVASQIARPLQHLARVADTVRRSADYSQRASWHARDEIGRLVHAFNDMLAQLDKDRVLQKELAIAAGAAEAQRALVEALPIPMMVTSIPDHQVLHANAQAVPWLGDNRVDPWCNGLEPDVRSRFFQRLADLNAVDEFEVRWQGADADASGWAVLSARRLVFQGRDALLTAFTPINRVKVMEQRLELWAKVFEASSESIIIMDDERRVISVNKAFCRSTGHGFHSIIGQDLSAVLQSKGMDWSELQKKGSWQGEVHIRRQSGDTYPAWLMVSAVHKGAMASEVVNYIAISIDITDRKAKEDRIRFLAQHDVLTELPNRALCQQRLGEAIAQAAQSGERVAVLFIDLDRFKFINDTLGHHIGDGLLRTVAKRLTHTVRAGDTVSRLGGDEFVLILRDMNDVGELRALIHERLIPTVRQTVMVESHALNVSCSVGVALYPDDAQDQDTLMRRADAAMYEAKGAGRDAARFFSPEADSRVMARQRMEVQLRQALAADEFSLHFQPRLHAGSRRMQGAEALLRWKNPVLGQVSPGEFIQLAEETGLIHGIGNWVLHEACQQWMALEASGACKGLTLSVNLSVAQLANPELVEQLTGILHDTGLPAAQLELELTESHLMDNPATAQARVAALKRLGVQIAIDDFGTGYSSLAYLKRFELDKLKVDRSFVLGMMEDSADAAIVHAVIGLGHTLGLSVVAEGVETLATAQALTALGCDELQGYCFSRPLPLPELIAYAENSEQTGEVRRVVG